MFSKYILSEPQVRFFRILISNRPTSIPRWTKTFFGASAFPTEFANEMRLAAAIGLARECDDTFVVAFANLERELNAAES